MVEATIRCFAGYEDGGDKMLRKESIVERSREAMQIREVSAGVTQAWLNEFFGGKEVVVVGEREIGQEELNEFFGGKKVVVVGESEFAPEDNGLSRRRRGKKERKNIGPKEHGEGERKKRKRERKRKKKT